MAERHQRGLPSLQESRQIRQRAIVLGRVRMRDAAPQFWLWTIVLFLAFGVVYWRYAENELEKQKSAVMARQRAFKVKLEPRLDPLRNKVEGWARELASPYPGDLLSDELSLQRLGESKGLYLRLLLEDAETPESIQKAADHSLHDGFTSCLFQRKPNIGGSEAKACHTPSDCPMGEICNEFDTCSPPTQPYNLRLMYRALRVLSNKWSDELHQATSDYKVRIFDRDLDKVAQTDVPIALELSSQARYVTILLDEMPEGGVPKEPMVNRDGGVEEDEAEQLQAVSHPVRLGIWDLSTGKPLVRLRTEAGAAFVPLGRSASASLRTRRAQQRQVNNCSIAQELRDRVAKRNASSPSDVPAATEQQAPSGEDFATESKDKAAAHPPAPQPTSP